MRRAAWMVAVLTSIASLGGASSHPVIGATPINGRILFDRCVRTCQIYTANPDGSAIVKVTRGGDSFEADWSPDGTKITYASVRSGDVAIWIVRADGTNPRQITPDDPDSDNFWPRFSADGRRVLFTNCLGQDCDGGIGSVRLDGTHLHLITPNSGSSYNVADPSPDGTKMTYMRWHVDGLKMGIYVSDADGSNEHRVSPPRLLGWYPDWSPTGSRIVFASQVFFDRPAPELYSVRPDGSGLRQLTDPPFPHADWSASYSPDGTQIVFNSDRLYDDFCCGDLFTMDAAGGAPHLISLPFDAYDPRWGTAPPISAAVATRTFRTATNIDRLCGLPMFVAPVCTRG